MRDTQAVSFLVIHQKHNKSLEEITTDLCPVLSVQQLYRISTMYWDDRQISQHAREPYHALSRLDTTSVILLTASTVSFISVGIFTKLRLIYEKPPYLLLLEGMVSL